MLRYFYLPVHQYNQRTTVLLSTYCVWCPVRMGELQLDSGLVKTLCRMVIIEIRNKKSITRSAEQPLLVSTDWF